MKNKILFSITIIFITFVSMNSLIDTTSMNIHEEALERAFQAFGIAKALNGVISLIQGTQLSFTPIGVGLTFSVGEILDPLNDLVERFSVIMLLSSISLGIQKLLLVLSFSNFLKLAVGLTSVALLTLLWLKKEFSATLFSLAMRLFLLLMLLRFAAIIFVSFEANFYTTMLQDDFNASTQVLQTTHEELKKIERVGNRLQKRQEKDLSWYSSLEDKSSQVIKQMNIQKRLEDLSESIEEAQENIINLATIFIVLSILLPMLFLWLLYTLIRLLFSRSITFNRLYTSLSSA